MKRFKFKKTGFTLIEMTIYVAILGFIVLSLLSFFIWANRARVKTSVVNEVINNANRAMSVMVYEIKNADEIYFPTSTTTQLSLKTINYLPSGEQISYIDFYLCGAQICMKKEALPAVALISDEVIVTNLSFTQVATSSVPSVYIDLTLDSSDGGDRIDYNFSYNITSNASVRSY
ncbi:MAG: type II secretion system protein [bacterium]